MYFEWGVSVFASECVLLRICLIYYKYYELSCCNFHFGLIKFNLTWLVYWDMRYFERGVYRDVKCKVYITQRSEININK